jgi:ribosomal protein S18 acetylase RimI-like enzyme/cytochrome c2
VDVVSEMLADAFHEDPMQRWLFPIEQRRHAQLSRYFRLDIRHRLNGRSVVHLADGCAGVAFWHPPGSWAPPVRALPAIAPALLSVALHHPVSAPKVLREVMRAHPMVEHWYLSHLAVAPDRQGTGFGGALVRAGLNRADSAGVGAYLETTNPDNLDFYRSLGFVLCGTVDLNAAPQVWLLWRPPIGAPAPAAAESAAMSSPCSTAAAAATAAPPGPRQGGASSLAHARSLRRTSLAAVAMLATATVVSCGVGETEPKQSSRGAELYEANCASCHGSDLRGTEEGPSHLSVVYEEGHHPDDAFRSAITNGAPAHHWPFGDMAPVPGLDPEEIEAIIAYVRQRQADEGFEAYPPR